MKDLNKALSYSFFLLKYRSRSESEIVSRLKAKGYASSVIREAIKYLKENTYINDKEFVKLFVVSKQDKGWGQIKIRLGLKKLGIEEALIEEALKDKEVFLEKLKDLICKKIGFYQGVGKYQKILRYFASRGFNYSDIKNILDDIGLEKFKK